MRITHICLCGPFSDGYSYQENLLTKYHRSIGYKVSVIASKWVWGNTGVIEKINETNYMDENNIKIHRLEIKGEDKFSKKIKHYNKFYETLEYTKPDIIFVHGIQFVDINKIIKYKKKNPKTLIYCDNHADFSNSASNWFSRNILHKIIWKYFAKKIEPFSEKIYGVMPSRVDFLNQVYNISKSKSELLVLGADDELVELSLRESSKKEIRNKYNILDDEFLIITGGKIDKAKWQTLNLIKAINNIDDGKIKLLIFGSVENSLKDEFLNLINGKEKIIYTGWISSEKSYKYFATADLVVFPGRHSVFWEQVAAIGTPLMVKYWKGTTHINHSDNCIFLYKDDVKEIQSSLENILLDYNKYYELKRAAMNPNKNKFMYSNIAKKSLELT